MSISTLKTKYHIENWNQNRPADISRVDDLIQHYKNRNEKLVPGVIYAWKKDNWLQIFDGIHRVLSAMNHHLDMTVLIQIYDTTEESLIVDEFKNINKSINVPTIYLEEDQHYKKQCIESIVEKFCKKYKPFVSPSKNHQPQNFNRDKLIEYISTFSINFSKKNVDEFVLKEFRGLNFQAKDYIHRNKIKVPNKCYEHSFFLFYLPLDYIKTTIENTFTKEF